MDMVRAAAALLLAFTQVLGGCGGSPNDEAGATSQTAAAVTVEDAAGPTGTVQVQVLGDAVTGNAGSVPPDSIVSAPVSGVLI